MKLPSWLESKRKPGTIAPRVWAMLFLLAAIGLMGGDDPRAFGVFFLMAWWGFYCVEHGKEYHL